MCIIIVLNMDMQIGQGFKLDRAVTCSILSTQLMFLDTKPYKLVTYIEMRNTLYWYRQLDPLDSPHSRYKSKLTCDVLEDYSEQKFGIQLKI